MTEPKPLENLTIGELIDVASKELPQAELAPIMKNGTAEDLLEAVKVGREISARNAARIQAAHDALTELGAACHVQPEVTEMPIMSLDPDDALVAYGETVKATRTDAGVKVGGYLVRYSTAKDPDLTGEYFAKDTDFDIELPARVTTYFHHGLDSQLKKRKLGKTDLTGDEIGIWAETILQERDEYEKFIAQLALSGKLGWSSGTVQHLMERDGSKITLWPLVEASLTHTPAEPRNMIAPLKSLIPAPASEPEAGNGPAASDAEAVEVSHPERPKEVKTMELEEMKTMIAEASAAAAKAAVEEYRKSEPATIKAGVAITKDEADQPFASLGEQLQAVKNFALSNGRKFDQRLAGKQLGMNEGLPSEGGFLVQTDFVSTLLERAYNTGVLASRVQRYGISASSNGLKINAVAESSRVTGSRFGGMQTYWIGEAGTKTTTMPAFRQIELNLRKLIGAYYATDELLQDTGALESFMSRAFSSEFGWMLDNAILNGLGGAQPLGIMASPALVTVAHEIGQGATIVTENIVKMYSRMFAPSRSNAIWIYNQDCEPSLFTMGLTVGLGGVATFMPPGGLSNSPYATIMGRPAIPMEQCATLGNLGDIAFVDPSQYISIDKGGIQAASSISVAFLTDETCFRFVYRYDGQPAWVSALTPATGSLNTLSPFVTLEARP